MNDVPAPKTPGIPAMPPPGVPFPFPMPPQEAPRSGCLKWGLVGCAGASVLLIVGLVAFMTKLGPIMDWTFDKMSDQVFAACTPDVNPEDKIAFRASFKEFKERAKAGKVTAGQIGGLRGSIDSALSDGKVTPDELRGMTAWLKAQSP